MKRILEIVLFLLITGTGFSQPLIFKGIVKDEQTQKPIPEVNIKVFGTTTGTSTDKAGRFSVNLDKIPVRVIFSCIGYEDEFYKVNAISKTPVEFLLRTKAYNLKEVKITSNNYSYLFKDKDYSVLDYELMDSNVMVLIYRTLLKESEIVLLSRGGDTLAVSSTPDPPPSRLYKDFMSNIHYFSKSDNAYQCRYNKAFENIDFLFKTKVDSVEKVLKPVLFRIGGRLYFQKSVANNFGTDIGYVEKGSKAKYIREVINSKKINEFIDDERFYASWNEFVTQSIGGYVFTEADDIEDEDMSNSRTEGKFYAKNERRAHKIEFYNMMYPVLKTRDNTIAFFNFGSDLLEFMDKDGKTFKKVPISFHKEPVDSDTSSLIRLFESGWRWGNAILVDGFDGTMYTTYLKSGIVRINRIDPETGTINRGTIIPLLYPEKMEIYKGEVYFLNKGINENWKLAKCHL
jgi:hypothetical protein